VAVLVCLLAGACRSLPARDGEPAAADSGGEDPAAAAADEAADEGKPRLAESKEPLGYAGAADRARREAIERYLRDYGYEEDEFEPVKDRWRVPLPRWDRDPSRRSEEMTDTDSPYQRGRKTNPFRQNVLKGDYPLVGQHGFFVFTALSETFYEARDSPTPSSISTARPRSEPFFGSGEALIFNSNLSLTFDYFIGNAAFKPVEYLFRLTTVFNANHVDLDENNGVNFDVREGRTRWDGHVGIQEAFVEKHLGDLSANYDFVSLTVGVQRFVSDFRGLLFFDNNLGARLTANWDNNRRQANVAVFYQLEKDTNSELNGYDFRDQFVFIANYFRQDFIWFGYTFQASLHYNHDGRAGRFDENRVPVRPPVIGDADAGHLDVVYLGFAGDGHIGRLNITNEYFLAVGHDTDNALAGRSTNILAHMLFLELSVDFDWLRPRVSVLWASGDDDAQDGDAKGFDSILDNPNFAGGLNSYWIRQNVRLLGVGLLHRLSAFPTLRSSKVEGSANFVNPGLLFLTAGLDAELTAELRSTFNVSYLRFAETGALEPFLNQNDIAEEIGVEVNLGFIWRPWLTNNVMLQAGAAALFPGEGFEDVFESDDVLYSVFFQLTLVY